MEGRGKERVGSKIFLNDRDNSRKKSDVGLLHLLKKSRTIEDGKGEWCCL